MRYSQLVTSYFPTQQYSALIQTNLMPSPGTVQGWPTTGPGTGPDCSGSDSCCGTSCVDVGNDPNHCTGCFGACNNPPADHCSGSDIYQYPGTGSCNSGSCSYNPTITPCSTACANVACIADCATPSVFTLISDTGSWSGVTTGGTNNFSSSCSGSSAPEDVYLWTASASGTYDITTCNAITDYDTVLYYHDQSCAYVTCNDDTTGCGLESKITINATAGEYYWIFVDGFSTSNGGYQLDILVQ